MHKSSIELKQLAKKSLSGKYSIPVGATIIYLIVSFIISSITQIFVYPYSTFNITLYTIFTIITSLLLSVLALGLIKLSLDIARNNLIELGALTYGLSHHPDRIIVSNLIISLIILAWFIPSIVFLIVLIITPSSTSILYLLFFLLFIAFFIFGCVMSIIYSLKYSLVYYILADDQEISCNNAFKESKRLMQGNLGRMFYLQISFIGWSLLGLLSCGIGYIWIIPYMYVTFSYFYLDVKGELSENKQIEDLFI